jgi:hypothetical protein
VEQPAAGCQWLYNRPLLLTGARRGEVQSGETGADLVGFGPAEVGVVQRAGFAGPVADVLVQGQGLRVQVGGSAVVARVVLDDTEAGQGAGLPGRVTGPPEQVQCAPEVLGSRPGPAQAPKYAGRSCSGVPVRAVSRV